MTDRLILDLVIKQVIVDKGESREKRWQRKVIAERRVDAKVALVSDSRE